MTDLDKIEMLQKLEWALETIRDQLNFGFPKEIAIKRREARVKAVLIDTIKTLKTDPVFKRAQS